MATEVPPEFLPEETQSGVGLQRVNAVNPRTGEFSHQILYLGTERQARALAEIGFWERHGQTQAQWHHLRRIIDGR